MKATVLTPHRIARLGRSPEAFTRLELAAVLAALTLLAAVAWPVLANTKPRAQRVTCANNLAWIGRATHQWASEHGDRMPVRVPTAEGGAFQHPLNGQLWFHLSLMSNELVTPKFLACPSDSTARQARDFSTDPAGGFLSPDFRYSAASYMLGLDAFFDFPNSILVGDRNLEVWALGSSCSCGVRNAMAINTSPFDPLLGWTMRIHLGTGNLLFADGRVEETSTARLRQVRTLSLDDNGVLHFLMPRYP
jgi:prepilin-type processing-associated H-X9-DG protein